MVRERGNGCCRSQRCQPPWTQSPRPAPALSRPRHWHVLKISVRQTAFSNMHVAPEPPHSTTHWNGHHWMLGAAQILKPLVVATPWSCCCLCHCDTMIQKPRRAGVMRRKMVDLNRPFESGMRARPHFSRLNARVPAHFRNANSNSVAAPVRKKASHDVRAT